MPNVTDRELETLQGLLGSELVLVKKYRFFATSCTDPQLRVKFQQMAARHTDHFSRLLSYLN